MSAAPPLEQASAPLFDSLADLEVAYEEGTFVYRRYGSANVGALERAVAEIEMPEGRVEGLALSSGMAALTVAAMTLARDQRKVVAAGGLYGGTTHLLADVLPGMGIATEVLSLDDPGLDATLDGAGALLVETISNPSMEVADIPGLAEAAHRCGARLLVDNTFASPVICRPLELGADVVVESTTKYISGHGDVMGGVLAAMPPLVAAARELAIVMGPTPGPLDAWLALRGLRTMPLRVEAAGANAAALAAWLETHPRVTRVDYPGLTGHPSHGVATRVLAGGYGGMLSFEVEGGEAGAASVCRRLRLITVMPSLADVRSTVSYPYRTSHRGMDDASLAAARVTPGLLRLSAGIEDFDDIRDDLAHALEG